MPLVSIKAMEQPITASPDVEISAYHPKRDFKSVAKILDENYDTLINPLNGVLFCPQDTVEERKEKIFDELNDDKYSYSVIRSGRVTVGFIKYHQSPAVANAMYVNLLAIAKSHKRNGYGRRLIEHVAQQARLQGLECIRLSPLTSSEEFYKKMGFVPTVLNTSTCSWIKYI